ncbi:MAG: NAD-dependent epimerase/dehydratase family protein [Anaerolineales bacterium]|nr:NAD-dependent epimerase/dehydratase family protein [Anaerolineales bacterium]
MNKPSVEKDFAGRRVLITGGMGFIGSNLARRLANLGAEVTLLDSLPAGIGGNPYNISGYEQRLRVRAGDLRDADATADAVRGQELIFNLAGQVGHVQSMEDPLADLDINVRGQLSFLEICRRESPDAKILYGGTRQVYGPPRYLPVDEDHPVNPVDVNAVHKLAAERYHILYHRVYGLRSVVLRMTNVYGPRMRVKDGQNNFLGLWIRQLLHGEEITVYGDGSQARDLLYVEDVVDALLLAALTPGIEGRTFNLGGADSVALLELAKRMIEIHGAGTYRLITFPAGRKKIDIGSFVSDISKIRMDLGWEPITPLGEGLRQTIAYFRQHGEHYW